MFRELETSLTVNLSRFGIPNWPRSWWPKESSSRSSPRSRKVLRSAREVSDACWLRNAGARRLGFPELLRHEQGFFAEIHPVSERELQPPRRGIAGRRHVWPLWRAALS